MNPRVYRTVGVVAGITIAACVSIPKFSGDPGPGSDGGMGDGGVSGLVDYSIAFGSDHAHYPVRLLIEGVDMLGSASGCTDENLAGIADYPDFRLDAMTGPDPSTLVEALPLSGGDPLDIRKATLRWQQAHVTCDGQRVMSGRSSFTMFPDGRITRFDHVEQNLGDGSALALHACSCDAVDGDAWRVYSYLTLAGVTRIELAGGNELTAPMTVPGASLGQVACARNATGQRVAFGWLYDRTRVRSLRPGVAAFMFDFADPAPTQTDLAPVEYRSFLQLGGASTTCAELTGRLTELAITGDPQLDISTIGTPSGNLIGPADVDGIFGGEQGSSGNVGYPIDGAAEVTLTTPLAIPAGWAVWLRYESAGRPDHYVVTSTSELLPTDYHQQKPVDGSTLVWFRRRLDPGTVITLTPQN